MLFYLTIDNQISYSSVANNMAMIRFYLDYEETQCSKTQKTKPNYLAALGHVFKKTFVLLVLSFVAYINNLPMENCETGSLMKNPTVSNQEH